jgi:hypothetical protein
VRCRHLLAELHQLLLLLLLLCARRLLCCLCRRGVEQQQHLLRLLDLLLACELRHQLLQLLLWTEDQEKQVTLRGEVRAMRCCATTWRRCPVAHLVSSSSSSAIVLRHADHVSNGCLAAGWAEDGHRLLHAREAAAAAATSRAGSAAAHALLVALLCMQSSRCGCGDSDGEHDVHACCRERERETHPQSRQHARAAVPHTPAVAA